MNKKFMKKDFFKSFIGERVLKIDVIEIEKKSPIHVVMHYLSFIHREENFPYFFQQQFYVNYKKCDKDLTSVVGVLMTEGFIYEAVEGILWRTKNGDLYGQFLEAKKKSIS